MSVVVDATSCVAGRIASYAAKQALLGHEVVIVHAEKAIVTGRLGKVAEHYILARARGGTSQKGPNLPSRPEFILKRTIRGMLSYKEGRGREAFKRIRCYVGLPKEFADVKKIEIGKTKAPYFITLEHLSARLK